MQNDKKQKNWLTAYVVTRADKSYRHGDDSLCVGIYATRGEALDACTDYVMETIESLPNMAFCLAYDSKHPSLNDYFNTGYDIVTPTIRPECRELLEGYIRDELGGQNCFITGDAQDTYRFDIDEADLEGCVTVHTAVVQVVGTDDNVPEPVSFWTEEAREAWAKKYVKSYWKDTHDGKVIDDVLLKEFLDNLNDFGHANLSIRDDLEISMAFWSHGIGNNRKGKHV